MILEASLNNALFEVTVEAENLFVELDKSGFELLVHVAADMVNILGLGEGLAHFGLLIHEISCWGLGDSVERHLDVVTITVFLKFDVAGLLVAYDCGIVGWHVAREFWEIGGHM